MGDQANNGPSTSATVDADGTTPVMGQAPAHDSSQTSNAAVSGATITQMLNPPGTFDGGKKENQSMSPAHYMHMYILSIIEHVLEQELIQHPSSTEIITKQVLLTAIPPALLPYP
jgi:hypothetical protein